ncbi:MAG: hypothetical protein ACXAEU_03335 [Candidatus Hodarchaeales archaeon]
MTKAGLRSDGQETVMNQLIIFALGHDIIVAGTVEHPWYHSPFPYGTIQHNSEDKLKFRRINEDVGAMETSYHLGKRLASLITKFYL